MRKLPPLSSLIAFEAAARHVSFQDAARELNLTPSAVSHQVKNLETWSGSRLFVRATRRLSLTPQGQQLLDALRPALDAIDMACAVVRRPAHRTHLAVHCAPSFAAKWLGPRLPQFMQAHPGVNIRLSSGPEPIDLAGRSDIDVHIAYGQPSAARGIVIQDLGDETIAPLCAPRLKPAALTPKADLLRGLPQIESQLSPVRWDDWCRENGVQPSGLAQPSFDRGSLAVAAAVDGLGVALETLRFAHAELQRGELAVIDHEGLVTVRRPLHFLCYRTADQDDLALQLFVQWLRGGLGVDPGPSAARMTAGQEPLESEI